MATVYPGAGAAAPAPQQTPKNPKTQQTPQEIPMTASAEPAVAARTSNPWWAIAAVAFVLVASLVPLVFNDRFYFFADTQDGAYGIWWEIGRSVLAGQWPLFSADSWMAGNHAAEGQWGLWNPLILFISVLVYLTPNAIVIVSAIKIAFLGFAAGGTYLMARGYGANQPLAFVAAIAAPLGGFTFYMDAPSWVTNLFVWAFFPWVAWGLRRMIWAGGSPLVPVVFGFFLVTIGYVHGTILLVLLFIALIVEVVVHRRWRSLVTVLLTGVILGLVALAVYLPGVLTAGVTARASGIDNDGFMVATLTGLASSAVASGRVDLSGWWGRFSAEPLLYIAWFLPLFAFVDYGRFRALRTRTTSLFVMFALALAFVVGPGRLGPLQFPARVVPWVALLSIVVLAVLLSRAPATPLSRTRLAVALSLVVAGGWLANSQVPAWWRAHALSTLIAAAGVLLVWLILAHGTGRVKRMLPALFSRRTATAAVAIAAITLVVVVVQARAFAPNLRSGLLSPDESVEYTTQLDGAKGEAFVVGSPYGLGDDVLEETLLSNSWYLNPTPVHNLYTPVQYLSYALDLCMNHTGVSCADSVDKLFSTDEETGERVVDLLSIDTVQILREPEETEQELASRPVPSGWQQVDVDDDAVLWMREDEAEPAGGVVWQSEGTQVTQLSSDDETLRVRVDAVPAGGGEVALSRLSWPGYTVDGGTLGDPLRGYLLTVDLDEASIGDTVTVRFLPPAWTLIVSSMVLALLLTVGLALAPLARRLRRGRNEPGARAENAAESRSDGVAAGAR